MRGRSPIEYRAVESGACDSSITPANVIISGSRDRNVIIKITWITQARQSGKVRARRIIYYSLRQRARLTRKESRNNEIRLIRTRARAAFIRIVRESRHRLSLKGEFRLPCKDDESRVTSTKRIDPIVTRMEILYAKLAERLAR